MYKNEDKLTTMFDSFCDGLMRLDGKFGRFRYDRARMDVFKNEKEFIVILDVPGFTKDDITIEYQDNMLKISASKEDSNESGDNHLIFTERVSKIFREVHFVDVDKDNISAELENGVLKVTLPRIEPKVNKVEINIK